MVHVFLLYLIFPTFWGITRLYLCHFRKVCKLWLPSWFFVDYDGKAYLTFSIYVNSSSTRHCHHFEVWLSGLSSSLLVTLILHYKASDKVKHIAIPWYINVLLIISIKIRGFYFSYIGNNTLSRCLSMLLGAPIPCMATPICHRKGCSLY